VTIEHLITRIQLDERCALLPVAGHPAVAPKHTLPTDVRAFYDRCGGAILFGEFWQIRVVPPTEFVRANPVIVGELCEDDISSDWYIFGRQGDGSTQLFTIDLDKTRQGRCYDSFWDSYGLIGSTPIIAVSFTDFIERALWGQGDEFWWKKDTFTSLGDAYDDM
jgi:antitoxin YokJ